MSMRLSFLMQARIAIILSILCTARAAAQHIGDILLGVDDGRITTGRIEQDGSLTVPVRVFAAMFGDSGCAPFTANPGFDADAGTFTFGTSIGWNALGPWRVWNGDGFDVAPDAFVEVAFASQSVVVDDQPTPGFHLFVQQNGGYHKHLEYCMNGCPQICTPPIGAPAGIYLLEMEMESSDSSIAASPPFWLVFNYLSTGDEQVDAMAWVAANFIDDEKCPGDLAGDDANVNLFDLLELLANWGTAGSGAALAEPNAVVDLFDLLALLAAWGACG